MNLRVEQKNSLKICAFVFLLFAFLLIVCGSMFESEASPLGEHEETALRQDQVHYWAGIPFLIHGLAIVIYVLVQANCLLKFCICLDYICLNIAIFVVIVEGPDWKKYRARYHDYDSAIDLDYKMLKPSHDYPQQLTLSKGDYVDAMMYSAMSVVTAILSILLCVETFLTYLKIYSGIKGIYAFLSGYEIVNPEISLKSAKPIHKFDCKGCDGPLPPSPSFAPTTLPLPSSPGPASPAPVPRLPTPNVVPNSLRAFDAPVGASERAVSPAPSDVSLASTAYYVCHEAEGIKLVGYKPHRKSARAPELCTHQEEAESEHYHFTKKPPSSHPTREKPLVTTSFPEVPQQSPQIPRSLPLTPHNARIPSQNSPLPPRFTPLEPPGTPNSPNGTRRNRSSPLPLRRARHDPLRTPNTPQSPTEFPNDRSSPLPPHRTPKGTPSGPKGAVGNLRKEPKLYDPDLSPSVARKLPLSLMVGRGEGARHPGNGGSRTPSGSPMKYAENRRVSDMQSPLVTSFIPIAPAPPPLPSEEANTPRDGDRSPGKYPPLTSDIFPVPPSTLPSTRLKMREGRRVSFADISGQQGTPENIPTSPEKQLDTLI